MIQIKRAYEPYSKSDGYRVLVDRLWPRGMSKEKLKIDEWAKDFAPSKELREWFKHQPERWKSFTSRYKKELQSPEAQAWLKSLAKREKKQTVTLVYGAKNEKYNNAVFLRTLIKGKKF